MKFLAILPAVALLSAPAFAAPYVNVEANSGFTGSDYTGTSTDFHVGVDGTEGVASWYIQGGPTVVSPDGGEAETILTAKVGGGVGVSDALSVYGEISAAFDDTNSYGTKAGLKYRF
jgi:hypothetical protein